MTATSILAAVGSGSLVCFTLGLIGGGGSTLPGYDVFRVRPHHTIDAQQAVATKNEGRDS